MRRPRVVQVAQRASVLVAGEARYPGLEARDGAVDGGQCGGGVALAMLVLLGQLDGRGTSPRPQLLPDGHRCVVLPVRRRSSARRRPRSVAMVSSGDAARRARTASAGRPERS